MPGSDALAIADRHRALERSDRAAERLGVVDPGVEEARHEGGDHLGVGRDRGGDPQVVRDAEVGVVVDVAVERGDDVRRHDAAGLLDLVAVQRMGVGLADDPDARPAGVTEHGQPAVR